jgi:hypothetical protein
MECSIFFVRCVWGMKTLQNLTVKRSWSRALVASPAECLLTRASGWGNWNKIIHDKCSVTFQKRIHDCDTREAKSDDDNKGDERRWRVGMTTGRHEKLSAAAAKWFGRCTWHRQKKQEEKEVKTFAKFLPSWSNLQVQFSLHHHHRLCSLCFQTLASAFERDAR